MKYSKAMKLEGLELETICKKIKLDSLVKLANLISSEYAKFMSFENE